jgi:hypothetical protein
MKNYITVFSIFIYFGISMILLIVFSSFVCPLYAFSPAFPLQQIQDDSNDWINMDTKQPALSKGYFAPDYMGITDIRQVSYFSDGQFLNATLWTYLPFIDKPTKYEQVNYGMLIDSDFDRNTGFGGIDYLYQIGWDSNTKTWNKMLWELSSTGEEKTLINQKNTTGFFEKKRAYVVLPLNLSYLHYPQKYRITFYAEVKRNEKEGFLTDFTRTIAIPPLKIDITTIPQFLSIRPGENKTITLQINSTKGFEPSVYLSTKDETSDVISAIKFNKTRIPSYGIATIPMTISSSTYAPSRTYTIFIFANSTFPSENQIKEEFFRSSLSTSPLTLDKIPSIPQAEEKSQNVIGQSAILVTVLDPLTWLDQANELWGKMGPLIQFFYGIVVGIAPWIFSKLKKKIKAKD